MKGFIIPWQDPEPGSGRWVGLRLAHPTHILPGLLTWFLLGAASPAVGGPIINVQPGRPTPPPEVVPIKLVLHSAAEPRPALKYLLLPDIRDQSPGNAALLYYRAYSPEWSFQRYPKDWYEQVDKLQKAPLQELLKAALPVPLEGGMLKEMNLAARREFCDWEMTPRLRQEGISFLLPDMQGFRFVGKILALRARVQMARGNFDQAIATLQTGFALGRHVGQAPILVCNLVGLAIANFMVEQVETWIQQPKAPNLYWALTDLPRPLIDLHRGLQGEKLIIHALVPNYREIQTIPMSAQQVQKQISHLAEMLRMLEGPQSGGQKKFPDILALYFRALTVYPTAKKNLLEQGRDPKLLDAMSAFQVVLIYHLDLYEQRRDDLFKWARLPYWEALPGLKRAEEEVYKLRARSEPGLDLAGALLRPMARLRFGQDRLERRLAALRCIEAIRLYGASHAGKLPEKLSAIQEVPVPLDPVTGKEFEYRLEGNQAVLSAPPPPGEKPEVNNTLIYKIQMVR